MLQEGKTHVWHFGERDQPSILSARTQARLRQLVENSHGEDTTLIAVWELENGYSNLGTYVIEVYTSTGNTEHDLVVQYGMTYHIMRRNQPKAHLLSLDGFEVIIEYREQVLGVTITPTDDQMQAFLDRYKQGIEEWIVHCRTLPEIRHPWYMSALEIMENICSFFSETEMTQHIRGRRYARDLVTSQTRFGPPSQGSALATLQNAHARARDRLYEIWKKNCADYDFPAPPPEIDHLCPRVLPTIAYQDQTYRKVTIFGQVAIVPVTKQSYGMIGPGYDLIAYESKRRITSWIPTNLGGRDGACTYAQSLSALLDWQQFETLTSRQLRGVGVRIHELLVQTMSTYSSPTGV